MSLKAQKRPSYYKSTNNFLNQTSLQKSRTTQKIKDRRSRSNKAVSLDRLRSKMKKKKFIGVHTRKMLQYSLNYKLNNTGMANQLDTSKFSKYDKSPKSIFQLKNDSGDTLSALKSHLFNSVYKRKSKSIDIGESPAKNFRDTKCPKCQKCEKMSKVVDRVKNENKFLKEKLKKVEKGYEILKEKIAFLKESSQKASKRSHIIQMKQKEMIHNLKEENKRLKGGKGKGQIRDKFLNEKLHYHIGNGYKLKSRGEKSQGGSSMRSVLDETELKILKTILAKLNGKENRPVFDTREDDGWKLKRLESDFINYIEGDA